MVKKSKKNSHWEIKEEFSNDAGGSGKRDFIYKRSWGGFGFGIFLMLVAMIWVARDFGWIPSINLGAAIIFLFGLFVAMASLGKR